MYIKYGKHICHFVKHKKILIEYFAFFNHQYHITALTPGIASSTVSKIKKISSTASATSVRDTSHQESSQITSLKQPKENEHYFDVMSIEQASLSLQKDIELVEKDDGKINGGVYTR